MDPRDPEPFRPDSLTRPDPALLRYYTLVSAFFLVLFPLVFLPSYLRYKSLRYRLDDDGVSMSWGVLNKRETYLTYRRLQDIQVSQGLLQRKLGLAEVHLHTASGSAGAEMKMEGITRPERLRDFLYARMRGAEQEEGMGEAGAREGTSPPAPGTAEQSGAAPSRPGAASGRSAPAPGPSSGASPHSDEALHLLTQIRDELRARNRASGPEKAG